MRIALVHDYIKEYGGAERVLEVLHELYPDAPVYTTVYLPQFLGPHRERFKNWEIRESWAIWVPFRHKLISPLRLLSPLLFKSFDFSEYDVVIVSATGAYSPNMIDKKFALQACYCHTPPRYLYGYETAREWKKNPLFNILGTVLNQFLRRVDVESSENVDYFIANSREVASRIKKLYNRDSTVIYPPVDTESIKYKVLSIKEKNKKIPNTKYLIPNAYFLAGGRLARPKHIDLIIKACGELGVPLKIFGKGFAGYEQILKQVQNDTSRLRLDNIEFLGEVTDEEKFELMKNSKAYIFAATDEDFGITPVEAMSVGTPVIAYRGGGLLESVVEDKTGVFFDELTEESYLDYEPMTKILGS